MFDLQLRHSGRILPASQHDHRARAERPDLRQHGIPGQHHLISHHRDDAELMSQKDSHRHASRRDAGLLPEQDDTTPDGDGSLLDHSLVLYGSGMATAICIATPICRVARRQTGRQVKTGYHHAYKQDTPMGICC